MNHLVEHVGMVVSWNFNNSKTQKYCILYISDDVWKVYKLIKRRKKNKILENRFDWNIKLDELCNAQYEEHQNAIGNL